MLRNARGEGGKPMHKMGLVMPAIFAAAFGIPGIAMTITSAFTNFKSMRQTSWIEVSAMPWYEGSDLDQINQRDIRYSYRFEGREYEAKGIGSVTESDTVNHLIRTVKKAVTDESSIQGWINPNNPEKSTLVKPGATMLPLFFAIFGFSHGILGIVMGTHFLAAKKKDSAIQLRRTQFPDQPVNWREDWARGVSKASQMNGRWLWFLASIVSAISIWWTVINQWLWDSDLKWLVSLACIPGCIPFYFLKRSLNNYRINRNLELEFSDDLKSDQSNQRFRLVSPDGILAPALSGLIEWKVTNTKEKGGGEQTVKDETESILEMAGRSADSITLKGDIPVGKPTTVFEEKTKSTWEVKGKGAGFTVGPFELPVFDAATASDQRKAEQPVTDFDDFQTRMAMEKITMHNEGSDVIFDFEKNRFPAMTLPFLIVGIGFVGFSIAPHFLETPITFKLFGALFGIIGLLLAGVGCYFRQCRTQLRIDDGEIAINRKAFGINSSRVFRRDEIQSVKVKQGLIANNKAYYQSRVKLKDGSEASLAPMFASEENCELFGNFVCGSD